MKDDDDDDGGGKGGKGGEAGRPPRTALYRRRYLIWFWLPGSRSCSRNFYGISCNCKILTLVVFSDMMAS